MNKLFAALLPLPLQYWDFLRFPPHPLPNTGWPATRTSKARIIPG